MMFVKEEPEKKTHGEDALRANWSSQLEVQLVPVETQN